MNRETSRDIQKIAIMLFKEKNFNQVTIDDICKASGITKGTFYYHYSSKDQLLFDFFEGARTISAEATRILSISDNCWQKLWTCLEPTVEWTSAAGPTILSQVIISNITKQIDSLAASNEPEISKIYQGIIRKGQETGQFENQSDTSLVYRNLKNVTFGIATQWCISGGGFDYKQRVKEDVICLVSVRKDLLNYESL